MQATIAMLTGDACAGHAVGTVGGAAARAYLARRLQQIGADATTPDRC